MRNQPWMTAVAGTAMLIASQNPLSGQTPEYGGPAAYYDASGAQYAGPNGYYADPNSAGGYGDQYALFPQGVPDGYQPWPQLSPFEPGNVAQTSMYNKQGLWFRELLYHQRTFTGSIEAMAVKYRNAGDAIVGSPYAVPSDMGGLGTPAGQAVPGYAGSFPLVGNFTPPVNGYYSVSNLIFPYPALSTSATYNTVADPGGAPIWNARAVGNPPTTGGIKGSMGYFNEDDTGVMLGAWWGGKADSDFSRGNEYINGVQVNQSITAILQGQNLTPANGNIPLYNGESGGGVDFGAGSTAKYDVLYSLRSTTEAAGANISLYHQPWAKSDGFKIRPTMGLRYQYIGEGFAFRGIDSGFNYNVDANVAGSTGGTSSSSTNRPVPTSLVRAYDQYTATLNSNVTSHIAGPEVGFRIDLGETKSKNFHVWAESNLGLAVNSEQITLNGDNIGDPLVDVRFNLQSPPRMLDPNNQSAFASRKNTAHVSPTFQQSIYADMNLLDVIPVVNKMTMFENCTFRVGYSFLWVGEVSRPADSIVWQGYPLYPEIQTNRSSWWVNQFNFGLNWTY